MDTHSFKEVLVLVYVTVSNIFQKTLKKKVESKELMVLTHYLQGEKNILRQLTSRSNKYVIKACPPSVSKNLRLMLRLFSRQFSRLHGAVGFILELHTTGD